MLAFASMRDDLAFEVAAKSSNSEPLGDGRTSLEGQ